MEPLLTTVWQRRAGLVLTLFASIFALGLSWPASGGPAQQAAARLKVDSTRPLSACAVPTSESVWTTSRNDTPEPDPSNTGNSDDDDDGSDGLFAVVTVLPCDRPSVQTQGVIDLPPVGHLYTAVVDSRGLRAPPQ